MRHFMLALVSLAMPTASFAQTCDAYVGQTVALDVFDTVAAILKAIPSEKGEYETTAQFEARLAEAKKALPERVVIQGLFSSKYADYDADAGALRLKAYAFRNLNTSYRDVFGYGTPHNGKVYYGFDNRDVVVFEEETQTGSYTASNSYGASTTVAQITRLQKAIFESVERNSRNDLFLDQVQGTEAWIGDIPMTIPEAQAIKSSGKVAFVAQPKWPFYAEGEKRWKPSISNPRDVSNPIQVIVADIQCGLLLTEDDKVVAAFTTR